MAVKPVPPLINWGHPLAKGLVFDADFFEGGADPKPIDSASKVVPVMTGTAWSIGPYGRNIRFTDSTNIITYTSNSTQNTVPAITIETLVFPTAVNAAGESRVIHKGSSSGVKYFDLALVTGNKFEFAAGFATADDAFDSPAVASLSAWYHVVVTYVFGTLGTVPIMYINAVPQTLTRINGSGAAAADTTELNIGNRTSAGGSTKGWVGDICYLRMWNRALTTTEVRQLYVDYWQIYQKPRRK